MKNVLLIGIAGVYNYGCEAIVRGTVSILKSVDPDIQVSYASYNYEDDKERLSGCDVHVIMRPKRKRWTIHNVLRKLLSYVGIRYIVPYDTLSWIKNFDTVFSIGGDIYTLNPDGSCYLELPKFLYKCQRKGLRYILWGASVGKFERNRSVLEFYKKHLPQIDLIVAREPDTVAYLERLGVKGNVCLAPDPAFQIKGFRKTEKTDSGTVLGINLSPLSALYEYGSEEKAIKVQVQSLIRLMELMDSDVVLLPHVLSPYPNDNDLAYLRNLYGVVPDVWRERITLVDTDPGFLGIKSYLSCCDYVIAARMHCAINAITTSVPTLFLSYSDKSKGMSKFVYGSEDFVISLKDFEDTHLVVDKLRDLPSVSRLAWIQEFDYGALFAG